MGARWSAVIAGLTLLVGCSTSSALAPTSESSLVTASTAASISVTASSADTTTRVTAPPLTTTTTTATSEPEPTTTAPVSSEPEPTTAPPPPPPPPPPATTSSTSSPVGAVVVIDPGHNGANGRHPDIINALVNSGFGQTKPCNTTGTETNDGYPEHAFTWSVATQVRDLLQAQGVTVIMTRESDDGVGPCVNKRAAVGNDNNADAVVSIHGDGSDPGDRGFYAMTSQRAPNGEGVADESRSLAAAVRDALVAEGLSTSNYLGSKGLWKRDDLAGLNLSMVPTTMIEMGNMRDADDAELMKSAEGRAEMAAGIAQGILDFLAR